MTKQNKLPVMKQHSKRYSLLSVAPMICSSTRKCNIISQQLVDCLYELNLEQLVHRRTTA